MSKLTIEQLALQATKNNITTARRKKSILDMMFQRLYDPKKPEVGFGLTKTQLITEMSLERLQNIFEDKDEELTAEAFGSEEVQKEFASINKTVKNGFETAVCNGSTQASFNFNKRFKNYELTKNEKFEYIIVERKESTEE